MSLPDKPLHADTDLNDAWWAAQGVTVCWHERPRYQVHHNSIRDGSGRFDGYLVHDHGDDMHVVRTIREAEDAVIFFHARAGERLQHMRYIKNEARVLAIMARAQRLHHDEVSSILQLIAEKLGADRRERQKLYDNAIQYFHHCVKDKV